MITGVYCENNSERLTLRNGYPGISIVLAENRDGLEVRCQLPGRPACRKVLRIPEPLIGRVSAAEYFRRHSGRPRSDRSTDHKSRA